MHFYLKNYLRLKNIYFIACLIWHMSYHYWVRVASEFCGVTWTAACHTGNGVNGYYFVAAHMKCRRGDADVDDAEGPLSVYALQIFKENLQYFFFFFANEENLQYLINGTSKISFSQTLWTAFVTYF